MTCKTRYFDTNKWNVFSGRYYAYMEIDKFNSLDETQQFNTETGKVTPGKVNSAFAKMPIYTNSSYPGNNVYYNNQNNLTVRQLDKNFPNWIIYMFLH